MEEFLKEYYELLPWVMGGLFLFGAVLCLLPKKWPLRLPLLVVFVCETLSTIGYKVLWDIRDDISYGDWLFDNIETAYLVLSLLGVCSAGFLLWGAYVGMKWASNRATAGGSSKGGPAALDVSPDLPPGPGEPPAKSTGSDEPTSEKCPKCGAQSVPGDRFCVRCGSGLKSRS